MKPATPPALARIIPCSRCKNPLTYRHSTPTHKNVCVKCYAELTKGMSK